MSEICKNLWAKLDEYKRYIEFLKEENLERIFKGCTTREDFEEVLINVKDQVNRTFSAFNDAKLVDVRDQKVFWKDALVLEKLSGAVVAFEVNDNHRISSISLGKVNQDIIDEISKLEGLEELDLSYKDLSGIDLSKLNNLKNLKELQVDNCHLTQAQIDEILKLEGLEELDLSGNYLSGIDLSKLENLKNLKELQVDNCHLKQAQIDEILKLESLEKLDLSESNLWGIDLSKFRNLKNLRKLYVRNCHLKQAQIDEILKLESLEELDLSYNDLRGIDLSKFRNLKNLKNLDIGGLDILSYYSPIYSSLSPKQTSCFTQNQINEILQIENLEKLTLKTYDSLGIDFSNLKNLKNLKDFYITGRLMYEQQEQIKRILEPIGCNVRW